MYSDGMQKIFMANSFFIEFPILACLRFWSVHNEWYSGVNILLIETEIKISLQILVYLLYYSS
jgi:hypothetical protein